MAVVAGLFDSEDAATRALDALLQSPGYEDVETQVLSNFGNTSGNAGGEGVVFPFQTQTTAGYNSSMPGFVPITGNSMFNELDSEEADFFNRAISKNGGVLAMIKVDNDKVKQVGRLLSDYGAVTHRED